MLAKFRSHVLQEKVVRRLGVTVQGGPFEGMQFMAVVIEGCHIPKLLGCYEEELHSAIESAIARRPECVLNIGCAEGYYAVGLARRLPDARAYAFDISKKAQQACSNLALCNDVDGRVEVNGLFTPADFERYRGQHTLVVCDIEGAELGLLDPVASPALRDMDVIVECHDCLQPGIADTITARFSASHTVERIESREKPAAVPEFLLALDELDRFLCVWEWRTGLTPWLVMRAKSRA